MIDSQNRLADIGMKPGDTFCVMPANPLPGHPLSMDSSNLIGSRLSTLRNLHNRGITKLQIPTKKQQQEEVAKGNFEEQKQLGIDANENETQTKGYFSNVSRFLPSRIFGSSPSVKNGSASKNGRSNSNEKRTAWEMMIENEKIHRVQKDD